MRHPAADDLYAVARHRAGAAVGDGIGEPPADVTAHVAGCEACQAAVARMERVVGAVERAPADIALPYDVWPDVRRAALGPQRRARLRVRWAVVLAAAAVLVLATAAVTSTIVRRRSVASPVTAVASSPTADSEEAVARDLAAELAVRRGELRPETAADVGRSLETIDRAIADIRAEVAKDSGNATLRELLAASYAQRAALAMLLDNAS